MKPMKMALVAALSLATAGCMPAMGGSSPGYTIPLVQVERSAATRDRGGEEMPITSTTPNAYQYEDALIAADLAVHDKALGLEIKNKSTETMRLNWDEATFIEPGGGVGRVMHTGVRFIERDRPQPPSVIPAGQTLEDQAIPVSRVSFTSGKYGGWYTAPLVNSKEAIAGKRMGLLVPLEIGNQKYEYTFWFEVQERPVTFSITGPQPLAGR